MCLDTCGWCGIGMHCPVDGDDSFTNADDLIYCLDKDIFIFGDDVACSKFVDECEFIIFNLDGKDRFTV